MEMTSTVKEQTAALSTAASDRGQGAARELEGELRRLLADTFALYIKTKNFHWHVNGRHFRDYHLLLDEHADQLFGITDEIPERARRRCAPSVILLVINAYQIVTGNTSLRRKCWRNPIR